MDLHFKIYKPYGYLSQFINNQQIRKNKKLLGELYPFPVGTMAIGRLDEDSEGLLLLTTSGTMSETVRSKQVEKEYYVQVDGQINEGALERLRAGVEIGGIKNTSPVNVRLLLWAPLPAFPKGQKRFVMNGMGLPVGSLLP